MQVDQPLCYDCIHRVQDEVEVSIREAQQECAAYEAALARLREDDTQPYTDEVGSACRTAPASASAIMFACTVLSLHLDLLRNCVRCPCAASLSHTCQSSKACLAAQSLLAVACSPEGLAQSCQLSEAISKPGN